MTSRVPLRNPAFLAWLRTQPCLTCGRERDVQSHHLRMDAGAGMGQKPCDYRAVPLCSDCHNRVHSGSGERQFWHNFGINPEIRIAALLVGYTLHSQAPLTGLLDAMADNIDARRRAK